MTIGRIIDVSSNNHELGPIDWEKVAGAGVTAVFVKATEGTNYINPYYAPDMAAAQSVGLAVCAYHFARMTDPIAEARYFIQTAGRFARVLDYETNSDVAWARAFLAELGGNSGDKLTYGSLDPLGSFYNQLPSRAWVAAYGQSWPGFGVCWQFTSSASIPGILGPCDENSWHGDETQYETIFQINAQPPEGDSNMAITAPFVHNGQKQVAQAAAQNLWHKWAPFGTGQNETLAGPGGGTAAGCENNKVTVADSQPGVTTYQDGSVDITFEGTDGSAWLVSQKQNVAEWTGGKLA